MPDAYTLDILDRVHKVGNNPAYKRRDPHELWIDPDQHAFILANPTHDSGGHIYKIGHDHNLLGPGENTGRQVKFILENPGRYGKWGERILRAYAHDHPWPQDFIAAPPHLYYSRKNGIAVPDDPWLEQYAKEFANTYFHIDRAYFRGRMSMIWLLHIEFKVRIHTNRPDRPYEPPPGPARDFEEVIMKPAPVVAPADACVYCGVGFNKHALRLGYCTHCGAPIGAEWRTK